MIELDNEQSILWNYSVDVDDIIFLSIDVGTPKAPHTRRFDWRGSFILASFLCHWSRHHHFYFYNLMEEYGKEDRDKRE